MRRWGLIRVVVIALAAATALGLRWFAPGVFLADEPGFWLIVGWGIGAAGVVSALRMVAFPVESVVAVEAHEKDAASPRSTWTRPLERVLVRTLGDAGWLVLTVVVGMAVRSATIVAAEGWSAEVIRSLLIAPLVAFIVFASLLVAGWLVVIAVRGFAGLARMRALGAGIPAAAWWSVAVVAGLALAVPATIAVGLSDTASVPSDGAGALSTFLFGTMVFEHPWQYAALWIARLGATATAVSLVAVVATRWWARRRA